jgi:hypothetical protein
MLQNGTHLSLSLSLINASTIAEIMKRKLQKSIRNIVDTLKSYYLQNNS